MKLLNNNFKYLLEIPSVQKTSNYDLYLRFVKHNQSLIIIFFLGFLFAILYINKIIERKRISPLNKKLIRKIKSELQAELERKVILRTNDLSLANQDLQENTMLMEKISNYTPNFIYLYDLQKQRNIFTSHHLGEILGYSGTATEENFMQLPSQSMHPEDQKLVNQHRQKCLMLGQDNHLEVEYRVKDSSGKWHWLHSKDTVFEIDKQGKPTQILSTIQDVTEAKAIESKSNKLTLSLREKIINLESLHEQGIKLGQMNEFFLACKTISEAKAVFSDFLPQIFPNTHGVVYLINNSKNLLNAIAVWGAAHSKSNFEPSECWGFRRGCTHKMDHTKLGIHCKHLEYQSSASTMCLPMIAKGETLGMLYLRFDNSLNICQSTEELAETVAQSIAMSLANLALQEKLRYQSLRDPLTGLFNRRYLQESMEREIERAHRKQQFIGMMMIDIDHFKRFNDNYGHSAGDQILKKVAQYLISEIRQYDIACRYGGEELILVMPDTHLEHTITRAEAIRVGISELELKQENQPLKSISVSIGVSCFPDDGMTTEDLIIGADRALYKAKEEGRNCVKCC